MKNAKHRIAIIVLCIFLICRLCPVVSSASTSTTYTMTPTAEGDEFVVTQSAYVVSEVFRDLGLKNAEDMTVSGYTAYIADTGNHRVIVLDLNTGKVQIIGEDILNNPTGIAVDQAGRIYVVDYTNREVYRFDANGQLEQTFGKPDTPKFGVDSKFIPRKVAPVGDGGVYLIVEGAAGGIVYLGANGEFNGYYASNLTEVNLAREFLEIFLTEEQLDTFMKKAPDSYGNIMVDKDGLLYTVNNGDGCQILKHSLNGTGLRGILTKQKALSFVIDIAIDANGNMFALDRAGNIVEMTSDGIWLCIFGDVITDADRTGIFGTPGGIGVDAGGNLYVLDKTRNTIQKFTPTIAQDQIHIAIAAYNEGDYDTAAYLFTKILRTNESSSYAHFYMGRIEMYWQNYHAAAEHFEIACAREEYSEALWEIRNQWISENILYILCAILLVWVGIQLLRAHKNILPDKDDRQCNKKIHPFFRDFTWFKESIKHPIDHAYEISVGRRGNYATSTCIYLLVFVLFTVYRLGSGFLFSTPVDDFPLLVYFGGYAILMSLMLIGNVLVSSIQDSRGSFKTIFIAVSYSLVPFLIAFPVMTLLNNVFTYNEQFLCQMILIVASLWCVVNFTLAMIQVHDYTFRKLVKIMFFTAVFMLVAILLISLFYLLAQQIIDFVRQVYTEVMIRD